MFSKIIYIFLKYNIYAFCHKYIHLSIYLSIYLSIHKYIYLSIWFVQFKYKYYYPVVMKHKISREFLTNLTVPPPQPPGVGLENRLLFAIRQPKMISYVSTLKTNAWNSAQGELSPISIRNLFQCFNQKVFDVQSAAGLHHLQFLRKDIFVS